MARHGSTQVTGPVILAIENSTMCGSVALVCDGLCLAEYSLTTSATHSQRLLSSIHQLMTDCSFTWDRLDAMAVSIGPGSFTGLRIGLTTAKALAMATGKPLIGVSSLTTLACQLPWTDRLICPVLDARKHEVYTAYYRCAPDGIPRQTSDCIAITPEALAKQIDVDVLFVGDGSRIYQEIFTEILGRRASFASPELFFIRAAALGRQALDKWRQREFLDPVRAIPDYVRPSEAEINFPPLEQGVG